MEQVPAKGPLTELNDKKLVKALRDDRVSVTPKDARMLGGIALGSCHEHKVTLDFFMDVVDLVNGINEIMSKAETLGSLHALMQRVDPTRDSTVLTAEMAAVSKMWDVARRQLADKMALVAQCPGPEDTIS